MKLNKYKIDGIIFTQLMRDDGFVVYEARGAHTLAAMMMKWRGK